jgi:hypothetical protein
MQPRNMAQIVKPFGGLGDLNLQRLFSGKWWQRHFQSFLFGKKGDMFLQKDKQTTPTLCFKKGLNS